MNMFYLGPQATNHSNVQFFESLTINPFTNVSSKAYVRESPPPKTAL